MKFFEKCLFVAAGFVGVLTLMVFLTAMVWATWSWAGTTFWPDGPSFVTAPSPGSIALGLLGIWLARATIARRCKTGTRQNTTQHSGGA